MSNHIVYPTFKDAQHLYAQYSTIQNISVLYNNLLNTIDSSFLSTIKDKNIHDIYNRIILNYYPSEVCVKSSFINQILLNEKKQVTIFELPVGSSRADLCKINGESIAYEIKTDLDNFVRLEKQINDYYNVFEHVFVICSETNVDKIIQLIPNKCGIYSYKQNRNRNYKFSLVRNSINENRIKPLNQLKLMRKSELTSFFILNNNSCKRTEMFDSILKTYTPEIINQTFKTIMKLRFDKHWSFLKQNHNNIFEIDYQWFYKNLIDPSRIYK